MAMVRHNNNVKAYSIKQIISLMNKTECNCNLRVGESPPAVGFSPVGHWPLG